jgi:hypothetical protein
MFRVHGSAVAWHLLEPGIVLTVMTKRRQLWHELLLPAVPIRGAGLPSGPSTHLLGERLKLLRLGRIPP